jgi:uncharacterized membrane protein YphA (DoxX/SURF4 family)
MKRNARLQMWIAWLTGLVVAGSGLVAHAHERFVKHNLKVPLKEYYFRQNPDGIMGMHPSYFLITLITSGLLAFCMFMWFIRKPLEEFVERKVLRLSGAPQRFVHHVFCYLFDRPVKTRWFNLISEWAILLFTRSPGLVLMFSATSDSLVIPSYPLDPSSATFFKFAQVLLAVLILTGTLMPLCGAIVLGTWIYMFRWGWMVACDAIPVVTVAVLYMTAPWDSHKLSIVEMNPVQTLWVRRILGVGFIALGLLKVFNYNLIAGVADNYPSAMEDPMIKMFTLGTDPYFARENWCTAFGLSEVMAGFLTMIGVFTRLWGTISIFVFTKLMLLDFGFAEIPHIYPIAAFLSVVMSNKLTSEVDPIEAAAERAGREGNRIKQIGIIVGSSVIISVVVVFVVMYLLTFANRASLGIGNYVHVIK